MGLYYGHGGGRKPSPPTDLQPGDRVYVVAHGALRGYAPLVRIQHTEEGFALVRAGGAVACTICQGPDDGAGSPVPVKGFQGVRYRWWDRAVEGPFHEWQTWGLTPRDRAHVERLIRLRRVPELRAKLQSKALAHVLDQDSRWDRFLREFPS